MPVLLKKGTMNIDLHCHSMYSPDAISKPETLVKRAKKFGLGFALTDHHSIKGWKKTAALAKKANVSFIQGQETYVYNHGRQSGELIGLFLQQEVKKGEIMDVIDQLRAQDAVIVVAHPFDLVRKPFKHLKKYAKHVDVIEGFNARSYLTAFNEEAFAFASKRKIPVCSSSDAHIPSEFGNAYTEIQATTLGEFRKKLLKGKTVLHGKKTRLSANVWSWLAKAGLAKDRGH